MAGVPWRASHYTIEADTEGRWGDSGNTWPVRDVPPGEVRAGTGVTVAPAAGVSATFSSIAAPGTTSVVETTSNPAAGTPDFKLLGRYWDVSSTAVLGSGATVTVCFTYRHGDLPACGGGCPTQEAALALLHWTGTAWQDVTTSRDPAGNVVCGRVSSLSWFGLALPNAAPAHLVLSGPAAAVPVGTSVEITISFEDPDDDAHTVAISWGDGAVETLPAISGSRYGHSYGSPRVYTVSATVSDPAGASASAMLEVVVYDPTAGHVTGGGWIWSKAGWCHDGKSCAQAEGKANFGFVCEYEKGATTPTGNTEFNFKAGRLNFHVSGYEWLVVTGGNYARFKGWGTINGRNAPDGRPYKLLIWAGDRNPDSFRIKMWTEDALGRETLIYDNGFDQAVGGGSIQIHP
jgi:hypothetical protein